MMRAAPFPVFPFAVLLVAAPVAANESAPGLRFEHGDWVLACDNTRTCRAAGYQAEEFGSDAPSLPVSVLLTRKAGPGEGIKGELSVVPEEEGAFPDSATLRIGDGDLGTLRFEASSATARLSAAQVAALLTALRGDDRIAVTEAGDGDRRWELSGRGASAVLLKMDEFQGRVGAPDAAVRRGAATRPANAALPPLPMPVVRIPELAATRASDRDFAEAQAMLQALRAAPRSEDEACDQLAESPGEPPALEIQRLGADKLLVSTRCWSAAYNEGIGYWVVDDSPPWRAQLVTSSGTDYDKGRISSGQKGRGLGDCWWSSEWAWNGQRFVQTREATSGLCRGFAGGAWQLPTRVSVVED
jgi:invasion protein IalB